VPKQFSLGKNERLKSRKLIEQLFKEGKSFNTFPFRVYYLTEKQIINNQYSTFHVQFGVGVSSKNFKKAVDRNKIKRWTREAWRLQKNILTDLLNKENKHLSVFFIYTPKELQDYKTIYTKTGLIINKLAKLINETNSPNT
jgi:ribonuclease P protein component